MTFPFLSALGSPCHVAVGHDCGGAVQLPCWGKCSVVRTRARRANHTQTHGHKTATPRHTDTRLQGSRARSVRTQRAGIEQLTKGGRLARGLNFETNSCQKKVKYHTSKSLQNTRRFWQSVFLGIVPPSEPAGVYALFTPFLAESPRGTSL